MILGFQWLDVRVLLECGVGSGGSNSRSMSQVSKEAWSGTEESSRCLKSKKSLRRSVLS